MISRGMITASWPGSSRRSDRNPPKEVYLNRKGPAIALAAAVVLAGLPAAGGAFRRTLPPDVKDITIVVTDSGLGGLSIMAEAAVRLKESGAYRKVRLIFFNALFTNDGGYNSLPSRAEKIRVFGNVLKAIEKRYAPDLILVACNTLSVLLSDTPAAATARAPIRGIVEPGAALLAAAWKKNTAAWVLLFGTETTIAEGAHRARLMELGVPQEKIVVQSCPELASYIESSPDGENTALLISSYVDEALARLPVPPPPVVAGLVCTHYGYAADLWPAAFAEKRIDVRGIINPNGSLAEAVVPPGSKKLFDRTNIEARVVSMVEIAESKRAALSSRLALRSAEVAAAFRAYERVPELFEGPAGPKK
jgi:glutamate racemase